MTTKEIIEKSLGFLINDYNMNFTYNSNGKENYYNFENIFGSFEYYEWPQFGDYSFTVIVNGICNKVINLFEEYPKMIATFNEKHKGIKWLFKDKRIDYWEMIATFLKLEIKTKNSLFGLRLK